MAVVCETCFGVFIEDSTNDDPLYEIDSPYMMQKQFENWIKREDQSTSISTRKRKLTVDAPDFQVKRSLSFLINGMTSIIGELQKRHNNCLRYNVKPSNNEKARKAAEKFVCLSAFISDWKRSAECPDNVRVVCLDNSWNTFPSNLLQNTLFINPHPNQLLLPITNQLRIKVPPSCSFLVSELAVLPELLLPAGGFRSCFGDGFDVIIVDPPWPNKSVKRKRSYDYLELQDLGRGLTPLLRYICRPGAVVAVWATPLNESIHTFVLEELFPRNALRHIATWHWLKVTRRGDPICPLSVDGNRKVPYEELFVAKFDSQNVQSHRDLEEKMMISVPSALHSKKPDIFDVLKQYLDMAKIGGNIRCCELFARQLREGWFSWGREPVLMNLENT